MRQCPQNVQLWACQVPLGVLKSTVQQRRRRELLSSGPPRFLPSGLPGPGRPITSEPPQGFLANSPNQTEEARSWGLLREGLAAASVLHGPLVVDDGLLGGPGAGPASPHRKAPARPGKAAPGTGGKNAPRLCKGSARSSGTATPGAAGRSVSGRRDVLELMSGPPGAAGWVSVYACREGCLPVPCPELLTVTRLKGRNKQANKQSLAPGLR